MHPQVKDLLQRLPALRQAAGLTLQELEQKLILGPGWINLYETGSAEPPLSTLVAILKELGTDLAAVSNGITFTEPPLLVSRLLSATPAGQHLDITFPYGRQTSTYRLVNATMAQFEDVLRVLRNSLASQPKADAVASAYRHAMSLWPHANPSDIWYFLISRAYLDPYNHPAKEFGADFAQSWKRAGGWSLERIFRDHYNPALADHGLRLEIPNKGKIKNDLISTMGLGNAINPDKADVLVVGTNGGTDQCIGVVHVKASFAERRTDDAPMSAALIGKGFVSPLVTMDCKGSPGATADNTGELGAVYTGVVHTSTAVDQRGAKRLDIERDRVFDACFSYNLNTLATPAGIAAAARIHVCDFNNPNDAFVGHLVQAWRRLLGNP